MKFRDISQYKYQLIEDITIPVSVNAGVTAGLIELKPYSLTIRAGYLWDGASGPTIDCDESMLASLMHDAMYQLLRHGYISQDHKDTTDLDFHKILLDAGMMELRSDLYYKGVKYFGAGSSRVQKPIEPEVEEV